MFLARAPLSEANIRQRITAASFHRGRNYYRQGAVISLVRRDNVLQSEAEGSQYELYRARITFDEDWDGWCKHIVATLLTCLPDTGLIEERPTLDELLADLDREQLRELLLHLAVRDLHVADEIESQITLNQAISDEAVAIPNGFSRRHTPVAPQPIRRQVSGVLHSLDRMYPSEAYRQVGSVLDQVSQLLQQMWSFIEAGDGRNALVPREAITDECVKGRFNLVAFAQFRYMISLDDVPPEKWTRR